MAYLFSDDVMCSMFPASLGDAALRWFTRLPAGQIDNFRVLAEQFTARFITNSRVIKDPKSDKFKEKERGDSM